MMFGWLARIFHRHRWRRIKTFTDGRPVYPKILCVEECGCGERRVVTTHHHGWPWPNSRIWRDLEEWEACQ